MPEVNFSGAEGRIEGRYHHSKRSAAPIALVLHPHPLYGGTMNNRIVFALYQAFQKRGFSVLRFNFRGVGRSQGRYDGGHGELSDAASALDWLQTINPNPSACWIGGYSWGAWIGMQLLMRRPEIDGFLVVAPPAGTLDFSFLAPCPASGLMVHGEKDEVVPREAAVKLAAKLSHQKNIVVEYHEVAKADHQFTGCMEALGAIIDRYLDQALAKAGAMGRP